MESFTNDDYKKLDIQSMTLDYVNECMHGFTMDCEPKTEGQSLLVCSSLLLCVSIHRSVFRDLVLVLRSPSLDWLAGHLCPNSKHFLF